MINIFFKKEMLKDIKEHIEKLERQGLYSVCSSKYFIRRFNQIKNTKELVFFYNYAKKTDDKYPVISGTGRSLEALTENDKLTVAIYLNEDDSLQSDLAKKVITTGILDKSNKSKANLESTLRFNDNIIDVMYSLKENLINSKGEFVLTFPSELVTRDGNYSDYYFCDIFNIIDGMAYIKPDYIDSYISFRQGVMTRINKNELNNNLVKKIKPTE